MKQANNNEVDLLLRSLAARERAELLLQRGAVSGSDQNARSDHLDADELNSYAEGVVPVAARARYTEHLADCDGCRRIAASLAQAAGAANRVQVFDQRAELSSWQKVAAFFSPTVLRYAVPALLLTALIGIGILALRQQQRPEFIAQNQPLNSSTPANEVRPNEPSATNSRNEAPPTKKKGVEATPNADSSREKNKSQEERGVIAQAPTPAIGGNVATAPAAKDSPQSGQVFGAAESRPSYAPEPQAPPPPRPALSETTRTATVQKEQPAEAESQRQREEDKAQPRDEGAASRGPAKTMGSVSGRRIDGLAVERSVSSGKDKKDSEVETRKVSGRRFRHQGNAWVDTAYESSRQTINVARGSEQYRALVADEPGIRAIAEQLSGEVVVVWKGRAYRIH